MSQVYAICTIDGVIRLTEAKPADGQFGLAVGDFAVLSDMIWDTADLQKWPTEQECAQLRVPGTAPDAEGRSNLQAIAAYLQQLKGLEATATVIEFEDNGQDFLRWTVNTWGVVVDCWPGFQKAIWCGLEVTNLGGLKPGDQVHYFKDGHTGTIRHLVEAVRSENLPGFRALGA